MINEVLLKRFKERAAALEAELSEPGIAAQPRRLQALVREHAHLRAVQARVDRVAQLRHHLEEARLLAASPDTEASLREMAESEVQQLEGELPTAERALLLALLPPDPEDSRDTIVEIRAGTGGEEAALFAGDLFRMYTRYAEGRGWTVELIDTSPSGLGGYKEIVFSVEGQDVYRTLKYESGGHRVQRIPTTEASGRIHTSAATVAVLPEAEEIDEIDIRPEDLRVDLFRASGPGGQKVNKTESAVRLTHLPTGIVVACQDERSQLRNREKAMRVLKARLLDRRRSEQHAQQAAERRTQIGSGDRSERIRTYNFPQNRVTDHRIDLSLYSLDRLIDGELDTLVEALQQFETEQKLSRMAAEGGASAKPANGRA